MQLPSKSLVSEYWFIAPSDPALAINEVIESETEEQTKARAKDFAEQWRLYSERGDESHLKLKGGEEPTRWKVRHVTGRAGKLLAGMVDQCQAEPWRWRLACWAACSYGLVGAKGLVHPEGGDVEFETIPCPDFRVPRIPDSFLERIDAIPPRQLIEDIGGHILTRLRLGPLS